MRSASTIELGIWNTHWGVFMSGACWNSGLDGLFGKQNSPIQKESGGEVLSSDTLGPQFSFWIIRWHLFNTCLWLNYSMPGTVLGNGGATEDKRESLLSRSLRPWKSEQLENFVLSSSTGHCESTQEMTYLGSSEKAARGSSIKQRAEEEDTDESA